MRQSAGSWFQRASRTSAPASSNSDGVSDCLTVSPGSELAIAGIVMGALAEARHAARDPIRGPIDHLAERHARIAEEPRRLRGVDEPSLGPFDSRENGRLAQPLRERLSEPADAHRLRPTDIERTCRQRAVGE